ncbi:MAG: RNA-guided endonuclease InsQ/TnpB family protein [Candidatus Hodarchaeales archaeon]|jgi:putative transposase
MLVRLGYKYELHLNNKERTTLLKGAGIARFAWNWGLAKRLQRYKEQKGTDRYTDAMKQHKLLNSLKKTDFPWIYEVSKCIPQEALRDLEKAFQHFYQDRKDVQANKRKPRVGFPKFKKKHKAKDSFRLTGIIKVFPRQKRVQLPRLGQLRVKESPVLSPCARILSATVSRTANKWYVAFTVEEERIIPPRNYNKILGLDVGLARFTTLSSGIPVPKPKFLLKRLMKLRRLSKAHSRKRPGSNNQRKSAQKLAKFHAKVANTRKDFQHKLSTTLVKNHDVLVVEDLWVKGLIRNKKQSRHWADLAHGEFCRILKYKSAKHGVLLVEADRWFPSSKLCSNCLIYHPELRLKDRIFCCPFCGLKLDRDHNAAINLEQYFYFFIQWQVISGNSVAESSAETLNACGEVVRPAYQQAHLNEAGRLALSKTGRTRP